MARPVMRGDKLSVNSLEPLDDNILEQLTEADLMRVFLVAALRDLGGISLPPGALMLGKRMRYYLDRLKTMLFSKGEPREKCLWRREIGYVVFKYLTSAC